MGQHYLDSLFSPRSIAVFGASQRPNAVGSRVFENLHHSDYTGTVYAINPKYEQLADQRCYPDIRSIGQPVELAVIATPAATVPAVIRDCGEHGVRAAIIHSAGFSEGSGRGAGPQLPGADTTCHQHECDLQQKQCPARQAGAGLTVRGAVYRGARLGDPA